MEDSCYAETDSGWTRAVEGRRIASDGVRVPAWLAIVRTHSRRSRNGVLGMDMRRVSAVHLVAGER